MKLPFRIETIVFLGIVSFTLSACQISGTQLPETTLGLADAQNEIPTPASNETATVTGIIMVGKSNPQPGSNLIIGLASILKNDTGTPMLGRYNMRTAPNTLTDSQGRFVLTDIMPGEYSLVYDKINESFLLKDPETGTDFIFDVKAGKIHELGTLVYSGLPGSKTEEEPTITPPTK